MTPNWNQHYRENMSSPQSGNLLEVAGNDQRMMLREEERGRLSTGEGGRCSLGQADFDLRVCSHWDASYEDVEALP